MAKKEKPSDYINKLSDSEFIDIYNKVSTYSNFYKEAGTTIYGNISTIKNRIMKLNLNIDKFLKRNENIEDNPSYHINKLSDIEFINIYNNTTTFSEFFKMAKCPSYGNIKVIMNRLNMLNLDNKYKVKGNIIYDNCQYDKCKLPTRSKYATYCELHYYRIRRTGTADTKLRNYTINEESFMILNKDYAWILGLIWSDGCLESNNTVSITSVDLDMLQKVEKVLGSNLIRKRIKNENKQAYDIRFSNKIVANTLKTYGLKKNKSLTLEWPINVDVEFEWDFIRGVFDGDGCIFVDKKIISPNARFNICSASLLFVQKIQEFFIRNNINIKLTSTNIDRNNPLYNISTTKYVYIKNIYDNFYYKDSLYLDRKKEKFELYLNSERKKRGRPKNN